MVWRPRIAWQNGNPNHHADPAVRAAGDGRFQHRIQQLPARAGLRQKSQDRDGQQLAAEFQLGLAMAVGQKAEVADALKAGRQRVGEKTAHELLGAHRHHLGVPLMFMPVIFPLERNLSVVVSRSGAR